MAVHWGEDDDEDRQPKYPSVHQLKFRPGGAVCQASKRCVAAFPQQAFDTLFSIFVGQPSHSAVTREFAEELGISVHTVGPPFFMENIYRHEGVLGHEILAVFDVVFPDGAYDAQSRIMFYEDNSMECAAEWYDLARLDTADGLPLFPAGLKARLSGGVRR